MDVAMGGSRFGLLIGVGNTWYIAFKAVMMLSLHNSCILIIMVYHCKLEECYL